MIASRFRAYARALIAALVLLSTLVPSFSAMADPPNTDAPTCNSLQDVRWLLGDWQTVPSAGQTSVISESWKEVSTSTFEGIGETRDADSGDLKSREELRLVEMGDAVFYIPKVAHNALPVAFHLTECSEASAVFENPDHDFPKKLEYRLGAGQLREGQLAEGKELTVTVSDGDEEGFRLRFQRRD